MDASVSVSLLRAEYNHVVVGDRRVQRVVCIFGLQNRMDFQVQSTLKPLSLHPVPILKHGSDLAIQAGAGKRYALLSEVPHSYHQPGPR